MRDSAAKRKILEDEAQQIKAAPEAIIYMSDSGVEKYTCGGLTKLTLKRMRANKTGPAYLKTGARSIVYRKVDIDNYLAQCRIEHNADILRALSNPTQEEIEAIRFKLIEILFGSAPSTISRTDELLAKLKEETGLADKPATVDTLERSENK